MVQHTLASACLRVVFWPSNLLPNSFNWPSQMLKWHLSACSCTLIPLMERLPLISQSHSRALGNPHKSRRHVSLSTPPALEHLIFPFTVLGLFSPEAKQWPHVPIFLLASYRKKHSLWSSIPHPSGGRQTNVKNALAIYGGGRNGNGNAHELWWYYPRCADLSVPSHTSS